MTTVTSINAARGAIRAQTPPISTVTNISTSFVRGAIPPRTPSPAGTVIPSGAWVPGNQPVQLIRASIGHSPRGARIVPQSIPVVSSAVSSTGLTNISANIVSSQSNPHSQPQPTGAIQTISSSTTSANMAGQAQGYVATLATVLPARQQTATLVYSNPQQFGAAGGGQRLAVANPMAAQRQVRPIQISNARLPNSGLGVRVTSGNISIRGPNIPVLAPSSVLTSLPAGTSTTVTASNLAAVNLPAARIIQVQQQSPGGATQVLNAGRIAGNLMTLHPLVMNASSTASSTVRGTATAAKPSLTITHVGKVPTTASANAAQQGGVQLSQGATITASMPTSSAGMAHQAAPQNAATSAPIGIVMGPSVNQSSGQTHQIAQIVNLNQSGINVGHQIVRKNESSKFIRTKSFLSQQIIGSQGSGAAPLTITSRPTNTSLSGTSVTSLPASSAQIVRGNLATSAPISSATVLPMAKVMPQQQQQSNETATIVSVSSVGNTQNVYIHSRSPSNPSVSSIAVSNIVNSQAGSIISAPAGTFYMPVSSTSASNVANNTSTIQSIPNNSSISTNVPLNTTTLTASYAPQPGSFAVVPASSRGLVSSGNLTSTTSSQQVPVRFNPPLIDHSAQGGAIISLHQAHPSQVSSQGSQKQGHVLLPTTSAKAVVVSTSVRPHVVTTTMPRKRDLHGEMIAAPAPNPVPLTKTAVKNLTSALATLSAEQQSGQLQRAASPHSRPGSSDGSTTVSAHSSPGADRQEQEEFNVLTAMSRNNRNIADGAQFATSQTVNVPQMQANNSAVYVQGGHIVSGFRAQPTLAPAQPKPVQVPEVQPANRNGNADELTPRKRARKQQLSEYSSANAKKYQPSSPASTFGHETSAIADSDECAFNRNVETMSLASENEASIMKIENNDSMSSAAIDGGSKNVDVVIKKPRTCALLDVSSSRFALFVPTLILRHFLGIQANVEGHEQPFPAIFRREAAGGAQTFRRRFVQPGARLAEGQRMENLPFELTNGRLGACLTKNEQKPY